jgi:hypothetical protein
MLQSAIVERRSEGFQGDVEGDLKRRGRLKRRLATSVLLSAGVFKNWTSTYERRVVFINLGEVPVTYFISS